MHVGKSILLLAVMPMSLAAVDYPESGVTRLRILYPNSVKTKLWVGSECAGKGTSTTREVKVSGGLGFNLAGSKRIGIPQTRASENGPGAMLSSKSVVKEYALPSGQSVVIEMEAIDSRSNGTRTYTSVCRPAPIRFTPRAGQDYEAGVRWAYGSCQPFVSYVAPNSTAVQESTLLPVAPATQVQLPSVSPAQTCVKS